MAENSCTVLAMPRSEFLGLIGPFFRVTVLNDDDDPDDVCGGTGCLF